MSDARRYAVWPEPRSRSLKGSRPSVPHGTNFLETICICSEKFNSLSAMIPKSLSRCVLCTLMSFPSYCSQIHQADGPVSNFLI